MFSNFMSTANALLRKLTNSPGIKISSYEKTMSLILIKYVLRHTLQICIVIVKSKQGDNEKLPARKKKKNSFRYMELQSTKFISIGQVPG